MCEQNHDRGGAEHARSRLGRARFSGFAPKSPPYIPPGEGFSPFAVGYVELPEGIKIQAVLDCDDFSELDRAPVSLVSISPVPRFAVGTAAVAGARQ